MTIIYGSAGGWPVPSDAELLADSPSSLIGKEGAGVGDLIGPAGDVDGDGFSDLLVGDSGNGHDLDAQRAYVIFGRAGPLGRDLVLDGPRYPYWSEIDLSGLPDLTGLSAAGDVDGDGFDDLLIGTSNGSSGRSYLLLGEVNPWWETVPLGERAAVEIDSGADGAFLSGAGDMDGDEYDEFVVAEGNTVYLFEGQAVFEEKLELSDAIATFDSSEPRPQVAALGDVNGDALADFIYADGDVPKVVFGDAERAWSTQALDLTPALSGFLAAPGDVDSDGLADILVQNADGDANLILGKELSESEVKATLTEVQAAASAPYAAGADLNSDGSSDLLLVPSVLGGAGASAVNYGPLPHVDPSDLPKAETGFFSKRSDKNPVSSSPLRPVVNYTVDDDGDADFVSIQAAVDAAGDGDRIYVDPGVYDSFTVTVDNLHIWGVHADAVFVDGGGGDFAVKIQEADGVELKRLTLRNADNGVVLENAGVEGYEEEAKNILLERVLIHDFDSHAVAMDRVSTARLTRCTLAGREDHIDLYGATDPAMDESWSEFSTDSRTATGANGGMFGDGSKLYFVDDSAEIDVYTPDTASWSSLPDAPLGEHAGATLDESGSLWALRRDLDTGFAGPIHAIVYVSEDEIYVGGDFTHAGNVAVDYIARWNGSAWEAVGEGFAAPDDTVYDIKLDGSKLYAGGTFGLRYLPDKDDPHSIWENWGSISGDGSVYVLAVDPDHNSVYAGGSFDDIGGLSSAHKIARRKDGSWQYLGLQKSDANGIDGNHVSALVLKDDYVYLGGEFSGWGGTSYGDIHNLARIWRSSGYISSKPNEYDLNPGSAIYALEVVGDNIVVGGDFRNVMCFYDDTRSWCSSGGHADNLAILKPNKDWWRPDYLKANDPVRTMERDGDDLYIGGDFTEVGESTAADHVAHYDYADGEWEALDGGVNDTVYAVAAGDGERAYVGGDFFQVDEQAAFHLVRWDGSGWTWRSEQAFYEYDGSWHKRAELPVFVGEGSAIVESSAVDGGDGGLYAIPASGSRALYRYTDADGWETRADLPGGVGAGGSLAWADGYVYALRGGENDDFYRYDPDEDEWSALAALPAPQVAGAGASLAWDGRNWLYAWSGGNGVNFLRYCIDEDRWEELDDAPAEVNAGGGLARIGQNLYGVPGGDEVLWSYDPIAVYPEKLTLDHVAFVAPETVDAASWINLDSVVVPPDDFVVTGTGNSWVGRSGIDWSPEPLLDDSAQLSHDDARFLDPEREVYRVGSGTLLEGGYHAYRSDYTVEPCEGEECTSPNPIQAGVNSGANRVLLEPGVYDKGFYLVSGVEVIGDGADLSIVEPRESDTTIVRAEGVVGARLSMLTLHGVDGSGLALVEYRIDGGDWQPAEGTLFWSADMELPAAKTWEVSVRAQDRCGQYSEVERVAFSDTTSPTVRLDERYFEGSLEGQARDLPTGGEVISVEVRIDEETAPWQPVTSLGAPDGDGVQDWQFDWDSQWDSVTHTVWVRAADVAGNVGQSGPFEVYVHVAEGEAVGGYTEVAVPQTWLWLLTALVIVGIGVATVLEKRRRAL